MIQQSPLQPFSKLLTLGVLAIAIICTQCTSDTSTTETTTPPTPTQAVKVPPINRDSAFQFVNKQVSFGPRVPNSDAHRACKEWLVQTLNRFGAAVIEQDFEVEAYTGTVLNATNIIAQFNPDSRKRIVLAAHWDSRHIADSPLSTERKNEPILGADDGGSGVGVLLEIARTIQQNPIPIGIDIILFDAEDHGNSSDDSTERQAVQRNQQTWALGAQHWSRNPHRAGYQAEYGILLDMVGTRHARFPREGYSVQFAKPIVDKVWRLANKMGYSNYFANTDYQGGITDDHFFVNTIAKIPMIDIINLPATTNQTSFGAHWHTHNDNMDIINKRTLGAVCQVVTAVIYREAAGTL